MGSGCIGSSSTSGRCFTLTSSNCISYQGEAINALGICVNDTGTEVYEAITTKLLTILDGTGIDLSDLDYDCTFITTQLAGIDKNAANVIQALINSACTLKELIDALATDVDTPVSYDTECLTVTGTTSTPNVLQAAIDEICALKTIIDAQEIPAGQTLETYITNIVGNTILAAISSPGGWGVVKTGSGSSSAISLNAFVPPFCPIPCRAPLGNWNSDGSGLVGTAYEGWQICNGNNSSVDMRGFVPGGAINLPGISGPSLHSSVDPANFGNNPSYSTNILDTRGEVMHQLSTPEGPAHSHTATDAGHTHNIPILPDLDVQLGSGGIAYSANGNTTSGTGYASITVSTSGANQAHETRQPTKYMYFIEKIV